MAILRYPGTSLHNGWLDYGGVTGGWSAQPANDTEFAINLEQHRIYLAPARYSQVRKVTFAITFQHLQNGGTLGTTFRARIAPTSTSDSTINLETTTIAASQLITTVGAGAVWSNQGPERDAAFYPLNGTENQIAPRQVVSPRATTDAQTCYVTFERGVDTQFFADWDACALLGDDEFIAYAGAIMRDDLGVFTGNLVDADRVPTMVGFQAVVVQAPGSPNNCCTHFQATNGLYPDETMGTAPYRQGKVIPFFYRADEWDNIDAIHLFFRQTPRSGAVANGYFTVYVQAIANAGSYFGANVYNETIGVAGQTNRTFACRTADFKSSLVDGGIYGVTFGSETGSGQQDLAYGWWEIIQKACTKKKTYHFAGAGNPASAVSIVPNPPSVIGAYRWSIDQSIFDPEWYQNYPDDLITERNFFGGIDHTLPNDTDHFITINPSLTADITAGVGNQQIREVSSTPDANTGLRLREVGLGGGNPDPIALTGLRAVKATFNRDEWTTGNPDDHPGGVGFSYGFLVPDQENYVNELGPVFEIGSFDPEGCASTAAGLGDNPGILFLTNGSTPPKKFDPRSGLVDGAGICQPYRDEVPTTSVDSVAFSPDGGLEPGWYHYRYTLRNCCTGKESDPNPTSILVNASGASPGASITLDFSGVTIPGDSQICEICIYRSVVKNTEEEAEEAYPVLAKIGCFNPDDGSIFVDSTPDDLDAFLEDPLSTLNACPPCFAVVAEFRNRLFGLVDIPDLNPPGLVDVENGSDIIVGDSDAAFDRCILGKFIQVAGDCTAYEVLELLVPLAGSPEASHRLLIDRPYEGTTDAGLDYIICGHPNRLYISEPLEPEYWPGTNYLDVDPGDGDRLTGAVSNFNRLVIFKRRKTYVVAFREQPVTEIIVPTLVSRDIGCIAPRSVAQVSNGSVWLADRGLALYDGRGVSSVPECAIMNDLFSDPENPNYLRRDTNGRAIGAAGVFYPKREQYLLLLPTIKTTRGASLILVWDTELRNCTLLEFCQEFLSIEVARDAEGNERVYLGDTNGFVWIWDVGDNDGAGFPNATGTVRGNITEAGIEITGTGASYLEDSSASFVAGGVPGIADLSGLAGTSGLTGLSNMGLAGACVFWREANAPLDTPWQSRSIYLSTPTRLYVTPNWGPDTPSVGDEYMIGPIRFEAEFKPANYGTDDFSKRDWRQVIVHEPEAVSTELRTELLRDFQNSDVDEDTVTDPAGDTGEGRTFDLGFGYGRQIRPVGRLVHQYMGVRLSNFAPDEPLTIVNHLLMANPRLSK